VRVTECGGTRSGGERSGGEFERFAGYIPGGRIMW